MHLWLCIWDRARKDTNIHPQVNIMSLQFLSTSFTIRYNECFYKLMNICAPYFCQSVHEYFLFQCFIKIFFLEYKISNNIQKAQLWIGINLHLSLAQLLPLTPRGLLSIEWCILSKCVPVGEVHMNMLTYTHT